MDVLLVDDHPILHETLRVVVGSVAPAGAVPRRTSLGGGISKARQLKDLQLVLLDLMLPSCTGIDALVQFLKVLPRLRILIISATEDSDSVRARSTPARWAICRRLRTPR
jgi:DNA-binding NarL/FixJ family response regulator